MSIHVTNSRCGSCANLKVHKPRGGYYCQAHQPRNDQHLTYVEPEFAMKCTDYMRCLEEWQRDEMKGALLYHLSRKNLEATI